MATVRAERSDAARNRATIVRVATDEWGRSSEATMQSIARAAGIGQGTLYRHFPTRETLLLTVYRDEFDALLAAATELAATRPALEALRAWLDRLASFGRRKHALVGALEAATTDELHREQYRPIVDAITAILDAGRAEGAIRADLDAADLLALVGFLWHGSTLDDERIAHRLDLVVDAARLGR